MGRLLRGVCEYIYLASLIFFVFCFLSVCFLWSSVVGGRLNESVLVLHAVVFAHSLHIFSVLRNSFVVIRGLGPAQAQWSDSAISLRTQGRGRIRQSSWCFSFLS